MPLILGASLYDYYSQYLYCVYHHDYYCYCYHYLNALRAYTATVPMTQYDVPEVS